MAEWMPSPEAWERFLNLFDANNQVAWERYEGLRRRLVIYFEGRNCRGAEDLALRTVIRVIKRNEDGVLIEDVVRYSFGVARILKLEEDEIIRRENLVREELLRSGADVVNPKDPLDEEELKFVAFEKCLDKLPAAKRKFILRYYADVGRDKIDNRKSLSEELGITQNAVTLRAYQIRKKLEKCIKGRLRNLKQLGKDSH